MSAVRCSRIAGALTERALKEQAVARGAANRGALQAVVAQEQAHCGVGAGAAQAAAPRHSVCDPQAE